MTMFDDDGLTRTCPICGEECDEYDMTGAVCNDCILVSITYDAFIMFSNMTYDRFSVYRPDKIQDFMFSRLYGIQDMTESSPELRRELLELYKRKVAHEKLCGGDTLLSLIRDYIMDDVTVRSEYADWLVAEEVVGNETAAKEGMSDLRHTV